MPLFIKKFPDPYSLVEKCYTAVCPAGYEPSTEEACAAFVADQQALGWTPATPPVDTARELQLMVGHYLDLAQHQLDRLAQSWGYDSIARGATYVGDPYPRFAAEGEAMRDYRSAVWAWLDQHASALDPANPPSDEAFLALLPAAPARPTP